jgi:hypothetical protein
MYLANRLVVYSPTALKPQITKKNLDGELPFDHSGRLVLAPSPRGPSASALVHLDHPDGDGAPQT